MADKQKERKRTWLGLGVVLAVFVVVGLLAVSMWNAPADYEGALGDRGTEVQMPPGSVALYDPASPVEAVFYQGARLEPVGEPVALPPEQVAVVGQTDEEKFLLYGRFTESEQRVTGEDFVGGGGGDMGLPAVPQAEGAVFLRTVDGRYQPLIQVD